MNFWQKASLGALGITSVFWATKGTLAADCALLPQTAYKSKASSAVYYINRSCTKRAFTNETVFFAYFSSWKEVKITATTTLANIPDDPRGPMQARSSTTPTPSLPVPQLTQPVTKIEMPAPTPQVQVPMVTPVPDPIPTALLTGVMAEFLRCPTESERATLNRDFNVVWGKDWVKYPFNCEYHSEKPSRLSIYATLQLLKNIEFSKPLPFTKGQNLYPYLTAKKLTLIPSQNCLQYSSGWNYEINLGGIFARTHAVWSDSATCAVATIGLREGLDDFVSNPIHKAAVLVHEASHAIDGSVHQANGDDLDINDNSAWAAQFYFYAWVYMYGENVDEVTKFEAKHGAAQTLESRFSTNKCPTDSELKLVVRTVTNQICP